MRYHKKSADRFVAHKDKASFPIREHNEEVISPFEASLVTVERMVAAGEARRRAELKKAQNA